jgi:hypothetical protein
MNIEKYYKGYLKYKNKYINLKNLLKGGNETKVTIRTSIEYEMKSDDKHNHITKTREMGYNNKPCWKIDIYFKTIEYAEEFTATVFSKLDKRIFFIEYIRQVRDDKKSIRISFNGNSTALKDELVRLKIVGLFEYRQLYNGKSPINQGILNFSSEINVEKFLENFSNNIYPSLNITWINSLNPKFSLSKDWLVCKLCGNPKNDSKKCCFGEFNNLKLNLLPYYNMKDIHSNWSFIKYDNLSQLGIETISDTAKECRRLGTIMCKFFNNPDNFKDIYIPGYATEPFKSRAHCFTTPQKIMELLDPYAYIKNSTPFSKDPLINMPMVLHTVLDKCEGSGFSKAETKEALIQALGVTVSGTSDSIFKDLPVEMKTVNNLASIKNKIRSWLRQIAIYQIINGNIEAYLVIVLRQSKEIICLKVAVENIENAEFFWNKIKEKPHIKQILKIIEEYKASMTRCNQSETPCTAFIDIFPKAKSLFNNIFCDYKAKQILKEEDRTHVKLHHDEVESLDDASTNSDETELTDNSDNLSEKSDGSDEENEEVIDGSDEEEKKKFTITYSEYYKRLLKNYYNISIKIECNQKKI